MTKGDRPSPTARGYDSPWARLAKWWLRHNPACAVRGCNAPASHVDHVVPVSVAPWRRLDPTNLQSLCQPHHNRLTAAYDAGSIRGACDDDGNPVDPAHPWQQVSNAAAINAANAGRQRADPILASRLKRATVQGRRAPGYRIPKKPGK